MNTQTICTLAQLLDRLVDEAISRDVSPEVAHRARAATAKAIQLPRVL